MIPSRSSRSAVPLHVSAFAVVLATALATVLGAACSDGKAAAPTTTVPPCTVSDDLVPSCGAWVGASTPSADGTFDYAVGLDEYEAVAGQHTDIQHFYKRGDDLFPTAEEIALSERPGLARSLLFYNWKPSTQLTWREVADGAADATIATVAASLKTYPHHFFLTVYHEPENDEGPAGSGMTAMDYVDMYRHVVGRLRELGVDHAVFVMNYMGFGRWSAAVDRFWPGDDVVDWIGYDPYGFAEHSTLEELLDDPDDETDWPGFYTWATTRSPGTPIMVAEWGVDLANQTEAADVLESAAQVLEDEFPMIKAMVYWNDSREGGFEVRIDQPGEAGAAYGEAYAEFAADPYFDLTSTADAP